MVLNVINFIQFAQPDDFHEVDICDSLKGAPALDALIIRMCRGEIAERTSGGQLHCSWRSSCSFCSKLQNPCLHVCT